MYRERTPATPLRKYVSNRTHLSLLYCMFPLLFPCNMCTSHRVTHRNFKTACAPLCAKHQAASCALQGALCLRRLRASGWIVPCREHPSTSNSWAPPAGARVVRHVLWGPQQTRARALCETSTNRGPGGTCFLFEGSGFDGALWTTKPKTGFARPGGWFHTAHVPRGRRSRCGEQPVDRELKRPSDFMKWRCI